MSMMSRISTVPRVGARRLLIVALLSLSLPASLAVRQSTPPAQALPGVEVRIQAEPLQATVGDPIQIDLDVTLPHGFRLQFPALPPELGDFTVLDVDPGPSVPSMPAPGKATAPVPGRSAGSQESGTGRHQVRIVVAAYKPGEFDFPPLTLTLKDPEGREFQVSSPAVKILIESVLEHEEPDLRDLKRQAQIEEPGSWLWWTALGLPVLALLLLLVRRRLKRHPELAQRTAARPEADPLDVAESELKALILRGLPEKGMAKEFYVQLSEIVKRALESSYETQTVEKTTTEIVGALAGASATGRPYPDPENLERIETLLLSCDMVKFARYVPSPAEKETAVQQAFQVFTDCRSRRQGSHSGVAPVAGVS